MENNIFEGVIIAITNPEPFTSTNGSSHIERTIVVETEEMYPQRAAIRVIDSNAQMDFQIGQHVRCYLQFRANQGSTGRWFNDLKAWRITL